MRDAQYMLFLKRVEKESPAARKSSGIQQQHFFWAPPEGGLDLVTNRQGAI